MVKMSCRLANRLKCGANQSPNVVTRSRPVLVEETTSQKKGTRKYIANTKRNVMAPRLLRLNCLGRGRFRTWPVAACSRVVGYGTGANCFLIGLLLLFFERVTTYLSVMCLPRVSRRLLVFLSLTLFSNYRAGCMGKLLGQVVS